MKYKKLLLIPVLLFIISVITSILAFNYARQLDQGYIYIDNSSKEVVYDGEYIAIMGNIGYEAYTITVTDEDTHINIKMYNFSDELVKNHNILIKEKGGEYDTSLITEILEEEKVIIDELDGYPFIVYLDSEKEYEFTITNILNSNEDDLTIVLANVQPGLVNMNSIFESISFTTMIFGLISLFTIGVLIYVAKNQ